MLGSARVMAETPVSEGQILAGKYRVEKVLGSGGMGVVVAAWHLELEQRVAVKFLHPLALERADTAERFRREARSAAKIKSEHVARVIDVGVMEGGVPYMVMEHLEGHDVAEEIRLRGALPITDAVDFLLQAIEALAEAHASGIVHRDLKPANLFLANRADGTRVVKVLDFGISKSLFGGSVAELSLTRTATLIGSPLYMSPEQMRSPKDVDTRTDIWSLGVMLYEMITGQPPYTGDSIPALCASLLNDVPRPMHELRAEVSPGLDDVVTHCLAKDRQQRFATVSDLARALAPFGSSSSQVHVDRASRLLGSTDVTVSTFSTASATARQSNPGTADAAISAPLLAITPIHGSTGATPARPTVDSWGRTDSAHPGRRPRRRAALFGGVALGLLGLFALGSFFGTRQRAARANANATASVSAGVAPPVEPLISAAAARPPASVAPAQSNAPEVTPAPTALPNPGEPKLALGAATPTKPKPATVTGKAMLPAGVVNKANPGAGGLSDFGGRR